MYERAQNARQSNSRRLTAVEKPVVHRSHKRHREAVIDRESHCQNGTARFSNERAGDRHFGLCSGPLRRRISALVVQCSLKPEPHARFFDDGRSRKTCGDRHELQTRRHREQLDDLVGTYGVRTSVKTF